MFFKSEIKTYRGVCTQNYGRKREALVWKLFGYTIRRKWLPN